MKIVFQILAMGMMLSCGNKTVNQPKNEVLSPRFNHVYLTVSDMKKSVEFYTTAFNLQVIKEIKEIKRTPEGEETSSYDISLTLLKFEGQNFILEIGERAAFESENTTASYAHLGIDVSDIVVASDRITAAGAKPLRPITLVEAADIQAKTAFFLGPDGETIELMQVISGNF
ncbi:MAG: lactoylglutathione lyase [Ekhidna sp.]